MAEMLLLVHVTVTFRKKDNSWSCRKATTSRTKNFHTICAQDLIFKTSIEQDV